MGIVARQAVERSLTLRVASRSRQTHGLVPHEGRILNPDGSRPHHLGKAMATAAEAHLLLGSPAVQAEGHGEGIDVGPSPGRLHMRTRGTVTPLAGDVRNHGRLVKNRRSSIRGHGRMTRETGQGVLRCVHATMERVSFGVAPPRLSGSHVKSPGVAVVGQTMFQDARRVRVAIDQRHECRGVMSRPEGVINQKPFRGFLLDPFRRESAILKLESPGRFRLFGVVQGSTIEPSGESSSRGAAQGPRVSRVPMGLELAWMALAAGPIADIRGSLRAGIRDPGGALRLSRPGGRQGKPREDSHNPGQKHQADEHDLPARGLSSMGSRSGTGSRVGQDDRSSRCSSGSDKFPVAFTFLCL